MKKLTLLLLCLVWISLTYAQTDSLSKPKIKANELKLNLLYSVIGKFELPEITYERLMENQASIGISVAGRNREYKIDYMITPHFRYYFPKTHKTFFLELNVVLLRAVDKLGHDLHGPSYQNTPREKMANNGGVGGAFGLKLMFSKSFVMDAYFGLGKILAEDKRDEYQSMFAYPRIGIAFGPRF
ncbi:MAG: DUF3575 domain-containing protein [Bacteroidota bacterium]